MKIKARRRWRTEMKIYVAIGTVLDWIGKGSCVIVGLWFLGLI